MPPATRKRTNYAAAANRSPAEPAVAVVPDPVPDPAPSPVAAPSAARTATKPTRRTRRPTKREQIRTAPVRVTLDLTPTDHAALKKWCNRAAVTADLPSVGLAPVLRLLGHQLLTDRDLADRIITALQDHADDTDTARAHRHPPA